MEVKITIQPGRTWGVFRPNGELVPDADGQLGVFNTPPIFGETHYAKQCTVEEIYLSTTPPVATANMEVLRHVERIEERMSDWCETCLMDETTCSNKLLNIEAGSCILNDLKSEIQRLREALKGGDGE